MSTRATVWIKGENEERFLYHHCDGYMLDEEIDPILKGLDPEEWTVDEVAEAIIEEYEAYGRHNVDGVGWDSEYVYKIDVENRTLEKFECGINDTDNGDRKEEKTQKKYLVKTWRYEKEYLVKTCRYDLPQDTINESCPSNVTCETSDNQLRDGYLMGLASFMRNIHEKTLKKDFNLTDYEINKVFEYMAQTPPNGKK